MNAFTIKDLENLSGIKAHTIRIWEQRYSFLKPQRTDTNIRYYSSEELKTILNISLLNRYGYKISHIDRMSDEEIHSKIVKLSQNEAQQERIVNELIQTMVDLEIEKLEQVLDTYIAGHGIEKTITQIIFPFMERIGILWVTNRINPAQEHLVTNIIRQKLIAGIERVDSVIQSSRSILLFLPENEHHELGLLFMYYLLKVRGIQVLYIGANVPLKDVAYVANLKKPQFLYTHLTAVASNFNMERFLNRIHMAIPQIPFLITGYITNTYKKKLPPNVHFKRSLSEIMSHISEF